MAKQVISVAKESTSQEILAGVKVVQALLSKAVTDVENFDWKTYYAARATGEIFTTKFYKYETSTSSKGEKLDASAGMDDPVPTTAGAEGTDPFAGYNAFSAVDVNFVCTDDGKRVPTAIVGDNKFQRYGKVDVGVLVPQTFWNIENFDTYYLVHFSDTRHEGYVSTPWCLDDSGNEQGYGVVTKYYASSIDGILYSSSGNPTGLYMSYNSGHTEMQKKGAGYNGSGAARLAYLSLMLWIKYAEKSSQKIFQGCTGFNTQVKVAKAEENPGKFFEIETSKLGALYVGGYVSIGDAGGNTNLDRGNPYMHNIAKQVRITKIEEGESSGITKVYVDVTTDMTITETTYVSTMPCETGTTDSLKGLDGQLANDSKHPYKLGGVEDGMGAYFISLDTVMEKTVDPDSGGYVATWYARCGAAWSSNTETIKSTYKKIGSYSQNDSTDIWVGDLTVDLKTGVYYPRVKGTGDSVGVGDRFFFGGTSTGVRADLRVGSLGNWSVAGLGCAGAGGALSVARWYCAVCV